jgi:hypothetical protein
MTNTASNPASAGTHNAGASGVRGEIAAKWAKFSSSEIASLKNKDDLVSHVMNKYNLDRSQAQRDVEAFAKGRQLF